MHSQKATLFQMMTAISQPIQNFMEYYETIKDDTIEFFGSAKGHLGASLTFEELKNNEICDQSIGSMCFKKDHHGKQISVLLFRNGKMRICGGYPQSIILQNDVSVYEKYLDDILFVLEKVLQKTCEGKTISCLNGQIHFNAFNTTSSLAQFINSKKTSFFAIKEPQLDLPGRRGAYKMYLRKDSKTHIALDVKGKAQIFGAKSFTELFFLFDVFKSNS
jgi:hypothetical protein